MSGAMTLDNKSPAEWAIEFWREAQDVPRDELYFGSRPADLGFWPGAEIHARKLYGVWMVEGTTSHEAYLRGFCAIVEALLDQYEQREKVKQDAS